MKGQGSEFIGQVNGKTPRHRALPAAPPEAVVPQRPAASRPRRRAVAPPRTHAYRWMRAAPGLFAIRDELVSYAFRAVFPLPGGVGVGGRRKICGPGGSGGLRAHRRPAAPGKVGERLREGERKTSTCAVSCAFENPHCTVGASGPRFGSHYGGGLASARLSIGSPRVLHRFVKRIASITNTAEVMGPLPTPQTHSSRSPGGPQDGRRQHESKGAGKQLTARTGCRAAAPARAAPRPGPRAGPARTARRRPMTRPSVCRPPARAAPAREGRGAAAPGRGRGAAPTDGDSETA